MTAERYQQISDLYLAVLELEPSQRGPFLDKACAGDEQLRREVETRLCYEGQVESFAEAVRQAVNSVLANQEHAGVPDYADAEDQAEPVMPALKYCPKCQRTFPKTQRVCPKDDAILSLQDPYHLVGRTLDGKYRIEALIGIGGMGAVYSAHHIKLDRRVAFKILQPNLTLGDNRLLNLFEREAKVIARLTHENIVDVKDTGRTASNIVYIEMEWLNGPTLAEELISHSPLSFKRAADILRQIAAALDAAHTENIVHRDLKPSNVMLHERPDGREQVKVLDFGISKLISDVAGSPVSQMLGTPHYASPEQLQLGCDIDVRADIYSLGVILYQMLTGALPFTANSIHKLIQLHLTAPPPPLRRLRPDAPVAVEKLILSMMAKDPNRRPQCASDVFERFAAAIQAIPDPQPARLFQTAWASRFAIDLLLLVSVVIVLFLLPSEPNCSPEPIPIVELIKESPPTQPLEVTVVTVDENGRVMDRGQKQVQHYTEDLCDGVKLSMVMIPSGKFQMGSSRDEPERDSEGDEVLHEVNIGYWFFMGQYEVTREQWRAVASRTDLKEKMDLLLDPSYFEGDDELPVENINWYEAVEFCARLTKMTGRHYRLPSEAEWEYACRAGTQTPFAFGQTITRGLANYDWTRPYNKGQKWAESPQRTKKVGSFKVANAFGLYDMHGNVWELCQDWTDGVRADDYKNDPADGRPRAKCLRDLMVIVRGGGWRDPPKDLRSADRGYDTPDTSSPNTGLRVVMDGVLSNIKPERCPRSSR